MRSGSSATGNNSFNNLVCTGSNKHVVGLDAVISLFSSTCPIVMQLYVVFLWVCKKGPGWNDPMTAVVPRVKGFACYDLSFSRHNKNIKMEHFFLYILSRYFI